MSENTLAEINESKRSALINSALITADRFVNKNYLVDLPNNSILKIPGEDKRTNDIRLFKVLKLVYDDKERANDKLISVYSALHSIQGTVLLYIVGDGTGTSIYIGVRSPRNAAAAGKTLEKSFVGNFPGSILENQRNPAIRALIEEFDPENGDWQTASVASVTVVPSWRDEKKEQFVQGIEKFIDTMQGETFAAVFIARPLHKTELESRRRGLEELSSSLSPFLKKTYAYGENSSNSVADGLSTNISSAINSSVSNTTGTNVSNTHSTSTSINRSRSFNGAPIQQVGFSTSSSTGINVGTSKSFTSGSSFSSAVTRGETITTGSGTSTTSTQTSGDSRTWTIEYQNKSVEQLVKKIDEQLERVKNCEAFGLWDCAAYFMAEDVQVSVVAANAYKALMLGKETGVENSYVNVWDSQNENTPAVIDYVRYGHHPLAVIAPEQGYSVQYVTPGNSISGQELPLLVGLPQKSVAGLTVSHIAGFGRNVFVQNPRKGKTISIGRVHHMGKTENTEVKLDLNSFTAHCFVTGSTGSGKSNTTYGLLHRMIENKIPFLVIEPAKGEYKEAFGGLDQINIFTTNPLIGQMLKLNPFRFDKNIHVLEHLDRLIEIFNACWEMYAAMPAILKDAVEQIYIEKGWDLLNSVYTGAGEPVYPTFGDLVKALPNVINNSGYSSDTKGDYTGALVTRVTSLTNGISGQIFCDNYDISDDVLFDENTIVDLSRVGSSETKSLIMGILVLKLSEYRMANASQANSGLRHITVLEEAHNLLKRSTPGQGSNVVAKSVEMICNSIAEMRTYGEGFIIVDQSPTAVDIAAIKNTNTKILMRLPEKGDCEAVGNAAGLNEEQIKEMAKLGTGIAVVMQNNWLEAVLTHINAFDNKYEKKISAVPYKAVEVLRGAVVEELMLQYIERQDMDVDAMMKVIDETDVQIDSVSYNELLSYKREELRCCMRYTIERLAKQRDLEFFCESLMNLSGAKNLFDIVEAPETIVDPITKQEHYDKDSVKRWKNTIKRNLKNYLAFKEGSEKFYYAIIQYLLHAKDAEQSHLNCVEISKILF